MISDKDWSDFAPDLTASHRATLERDLTEVLGRTYFPRLTPAQWEAARGPAQQALSAFQASLGLAEWRNAWIDYLDGEGEVIMDPARFGPGKAEPRAVAQYWAVVLNAIGKANVAACIGEGGFDTALSGASDHDELWTLTGTLLGKVASAGFDVLRSNPFTPAYQLYAAGLRPRFFADEGLLVTGLVGDKTNALVWRNGALVELR